MVLRGNCTFYEKVRLAQINGAKGLLIVSKDRLTPPAGNKTQYEEIDIPVALLSYSDMLDISKTFGKARLVAMYAPNEPVLDYNMVIIFLMAVGTVAVGGYWAGSRDRKKRYLKLKRDEAAEKQDEETVDVSPVMICVFVVMCCSMLVLLYFFYDYLAIWVIAIFCVASSVGLHSCLWPFVRRLPFCKCRVPQNNLPYLQKRPQVSALLLSAFCLGVSLTWMVFRNEDEWAWVLQDALGIAFCLYMLKTVRLPTFKACTLLLSVLFVYDVFFVFITPFLTNSGESIMVEVAAGPSDSATHEKLPMVLKVPRLNSSPLALCDRPFSLLGFGDILVPGLLVVYCHRFDILIQSSRIYFVACTRVSSSPPTPTLWCHAYGVGLLVTFVCSGRDADGPARLALPGALHAAHQPGRGAVPQGVAPVLDWEWICACHSPRTHQLHANRGTADRGAPDPQTGGRRGRARGGEGPGSRAAGTADRGKRGGEEQKQLKGLLTWHLQQI
uniref:Signal peptide peptidase-like 2 n=1 Tax=Tetraodon nigroviridis TaxID=99883 RepID=H3DBQ9_TETNG